MYSDTRILIQRHPHPLVAVPIDRSSGDEDSVTQIIAEHCFGSKYVDCAIECVGFEASKSGKGLGENEPESALHDCIMFAKGAANIGVIGGSFPCMYILSALHNTSMTHHRTHN